jgi:hypothetical protein
MNVHPDDEQLDAESFVRECRRESRMFPRPHIDEVVRGRVARVVSKDFISGAADDAALLIPQAS